MDRAGECLERKPPRTEVDDVDLIFLESNADPPSRTSFGLRACGDMPATFT
jgi:hypothetical protein